MESAEGENAQTTILSRADLDGLAPGEPAVYEERVKGYISKIKNGVELLKIGTVVIDDLVVVRDGNNRMRALYECMKQGITLPKIVASENPDEPHPNFIKDVRKLNKLYGLGLDSFGKLPLASSPEEYSQFTYIFNQNKG